MSGPTTQKAIEDDDAEALASASTVDELQRLKLAEEVLGLARDRRRNGSRWVLLSQVLVSVIAVAGMLINAYQAAAARTQQAQQRTTDQERWTKEFERAQRADKYRAFFETSVLATDPANPDKRLVGYALLQEFVDDEDYNSKATLMLEESLAQELRLNTDKGLDGSHRNAVVAIVNALSQSPDCHALERASRSIDRVAKRHAIVADNEETLEIFRIYVRRLVGRAAMVCRSMKDLAAVRRPLVEVLVKFPDIAGLTGKVTQTDAITRVAQVLSDGCRDELTLSGATECSTLVSRYVTLCSEGAPIKEEEAGCALLKAVVPTLQPASTAPSP